MLKIFLNKREVTTYPHVDDEELAAQIATQDSEVMDAYVDDMQIKGNNYTAFLKPNLPAEGFRL